ncbi:hypothetical protein L208DRAFT_1257713 [Tricholoma matsutake]|nr:hypothetical protein L208DRAFT_1257713 [Tricholoma matsutake 945]
MSPTMQSQPLLIKFTRIMCSTLLHRIFSTNSLDLMYVSFVTESQNLKLTCILSVQSGFCPYVCQHILDAVDLKSPTPKSKAKAYIYTFLAFICSLAQADLQHLRFRRCACMRIQSELMASIYDKALKSKDYSGIVDKEKEKAKMGAGVGGEGEDLNSTANREKESKKEEQKAREKADGPKAGADVKKIVNLMTGDTNKISQMVLGLYFLYVGFPFCLYINWANPSRLLGWSAFAGFVVLLAGWPLNSFIAQHSIQIQKGLLAARDKRMGVLNELIGSVGSLAFHLTFFVKFIKFFAWEEQSIEHALDAREHEMKWMTKCWSCCHCSCFFLAGP